MSTETNNGAIRIERDGAVVILNLERPEQRNALDDASLALLAEHLRNFDLDPSVRCLVIAGLDAVFAAGADIGALLQRTALEAHNGTRSANWETVRSVKTPVISGVSGLCLGGGFELALASDVVIASETARFGLPETSLGLMPGAGGTQMLPRIVGKAKAMDIILTNRILDAAEAERLGLVSRVTTIGEWKQTAIEVAKDIASRPADTQRLAKWAVQSAFKMDLDAGLAAERGAFAVLSTGEDAREGMTAFLEKRAPRWYGDPEQEGESE